MHVRAGAAAQPTMSPACSVLRWLACAGHGRDGVAWPGLRVSSWVIEREGQAVALWGG